MSTPDPAGNLAQLAERLKLSDPLVVERRRGDRDPEPAWLVPLRRRREELLVSEAGAGPGIETCFSLCSPAPSRQALTLANPRPRGGPRSLPAPTRSRWTQAGAVLSLPAAASVSLWRKCFPVSACETWGPLADPPCHPSLQS